MKKPLEVSHRYDDIIDLPHHTSPVRPRMPIRNRAAQFAPFAALVGHGAAIRETAHLTDSRVELTENENMFESDKNRWGLYQTTLYPFTFCILAQGIGRFDDYLKNTSY